MYGEHFDIPTPDELIFVSWFPGGEVFRSGCTFRRGNGKIFYFQPGHETFPSYYNEKVQKVIKNAARWCAPTENTYPTYGHYQANEEVGKMKLGVFTPLFNHLTFEEMITEVAEKGLQTVEIGTGGSPGNAHLISISCLLVKQTGKNI